MNEANRCLNCKNKPCVSGCPVNIDIPAFIAKVADEDMEGAYAVHQPRPARCRRCAAACARRRTSARANVCAASKGEPVAIGRLERFVADWHEHSTETARHARAQRAQGGGHRLRPVRADGAGDLAKWAIT